MEKQSKLLGVTVMYSVGALGQVVVHHFPWPKDSPKLEQFKQRGFTFERPEIAVSSPVPVAEEKPPLYVSDKPPRNKVGK